MNNYQDIINLDHYELKHKRMSIYNRAAQFAPFSALTGYSDAIEETARITDKKIFISDDIKEIINKKLNNLKMNDLVTVTYFKDDEKKEGGEYIIVTKNIKLINSIDKYIKFTDNTKIKIDDVIDII